MFSILKQHPIFSDLLDSLTPLLAHPHWPSLAEYNQLAKPESIEFVGQSPKTKVFEEQYEPRIYLKGEVQTRLENWHDFFNMAVWCTFPNIKKQINARQYAALCQRDPSATRRTPIENFLTLFDENGAIIISDRPELIELIQAFEWHDLFWQHRAELAKHLRVFVLGHSLYEKAISPYVGMTSSSICLCVSSDWMTADATSQIKAIDALVATQLAQRHDTDAKQLQPFPILGLPGWDPDNHSESYYANRDYFRPKPKRR